MPAVHPEFKGSKKKLRKKEYLEREAKREKRRLESLEVCDEEKVTRDDIDIKKKEDNNHSMNVKRAGRHEYISEVYRRNCGKKEIANRFHCPICKSKGFEPSRTGEGCTFCDGTDEVF